MIRARVDANQAALVKLFRKLGLASSTYTR